MKLPTLTKNHTYLLLSGCLISLSIFIFKHKSEFLLKGWITVHGMEALHLVSFEEDGSFSAVIILGTAFAVSVIFSTLNICLKMTWFFWVVKIISGFVCFPSYLLSFLPPFLCLFLSFSLSFVIAGDMDCLYPDYINTYLSYQTVSFLRAGTKSYLMRGPEQSWVDVQETKVEFDSDTQSRQLINDPIYRFLKIR